MSTDNLHRPLSLPSVIAQCCGRRVVALVAGVGSEYWVEKRPLPVNGEDALRREFEYMTAAGLVGVPVAEAAIVTSADEGLVLRTRWMGDRTFERATSEEWRSLGRSLGVLQVALGSCAALPTRRAIAFPDEPRFKVAHVLLDEIRDLIQPQFLPNFPTHGDFQIGNIIRIKPTKTQPSHCIIDFEDCCLDYACADLGCMVWSMWAHGEGWRQVNAFVDGYSESAVRGISTSYVGAFAVLQHLRWIDFLVRWDSSQLVIDMALNALVELRNVAPTWAFSSETV